MKTGTELLDMVRQIAEARRIPVAGVRFVAARWAATCPQCKTDIPAGAEIGQPKTRNREGGRVYGGTWYCPRCAVKFAVHGPRVGAPWLTLADRDGHHAWVLEMYDLIDRECQS